MGETRVDLLHLLEDLRDAYPGSLEETILTEVVANALDSGAGEIVASTDPASRTLTVTDNRAAGARLLETTLLRHLPALLDPDFDEILAPHYPEGVRLVVNGRPLPRTAPSPDRRASARASGGSASRRRSDSWCAGTTSWRKSAAWRSARSAK